MTAQRILIIDDEKHLVAVIKTCLQKLGGWTVLTAETGKEGLCKASAEQPDAILLDVMMPDLDGFTVLNQLKDNPITQDIPIILLTAKVPSNFKEDPAALNLAGVLSKPFDPLTLADHIAQILGW